MRKTEKSKLVWPYLWHWHPLYTIPIKTTISKFLVSQALPHAILLQHALYKKVALAVQHSCGIPKKKEPTSSLFNAVWTYFFFVYEHLHAFPVGV